MSTDTTRRSILGGAAAIGAMAVTAFGVRAAHVPTDEEIERMTEQLSAAMKARHGGNWRWAIMHKEQIVMVIRDYQ
ncbi:hypothetical protein ACFFJ7_05415 [Pseudochelatococcus lubricantis]|uniref:hypothetical protein n=1 Tax=Pseudochelatococcus lubricantis TaxID=1538102 RepID=UPI0035E46BF2